MPVSVGKPRRGKIASDRLAHQAQPCRVETADPRGEEMPFQTQERPQHEPDVAPLRLGRTRVGVWGVEKMRIITQPLINHDPVGDRHPDQLSSQPVLRSYLAVPFEAGQEDLDGVKDLFEVFRAGVPAIKQDIPQCEAAGAGHQELKSQMVVLSQTAAVLVEDPVITGDLAITIGPEQAADQVDAADNVLVPARSVAADQFDLLSEELGTQTA